MCHQPRQAMGSLRGLRPPVHRKLSVTTAFGSDAVMPCVFNTWLMHSSLCSDKFVKETLTEFSHRSSFSITASIVSLCHEASPRHVWASWFGVCGSGTWASQSADSAAAVLLVAWSKIHWLFQRNQKQHQRVDFTACWWRRYTLFCAG